MAKLEIFFDYACPFCYRAHAYLNELIPSFQNIELVWRPCEAHPRPDHYGMHSDLCIRGLFYALDQGVKAEQYHQYAYTAMQEDNVNVEDIDELTEYMSGLVSAGGFRAALGRGKYEGVLAAANDYAYRQRGIEVLPSYRVGDFALNSIANIGVTKQQVKQLLDNASA